MLWNANGLLRHKEELEILLNSEKIDVCLISETHFTNQSYLSFKNFILYHTPHPSNKARGGSAIIVRKNIKHCEEEKFCTEMFQATTISLKTTNGDISLTAVYSPPRHSVKEIHYKSLIKKHTQKFIMGGDFNAKHTYLLGLSPNYNKRT